MKFKVLYILFFIAALFYANFYIGGIATPRQIMSVVMAIACFIEDSKFHISKLWILYAFFLVIFGFSSFSTGYFPTYLHDLIGYYFVSFIGYWSTCILIKKYQGIHLFVDTVVICGILNALVTIGQAFYISFLSQLPTILHTNTPSEFLDWQEMEREMLGITIPGLIGDDVYNGYFSMIVSVFCLYNKKASINLVSLLKWGLCISACFLVQQRAPFFLAAIASIFIMLKSLRNSTGNQKLLRLLVISSIVFIAGFYVVRFMMYGSSRYTLGFESNNRDIIFQRSYSYIKQNLLVGGYYYYIDYYHVAPHNLFLNALMYGGLLGGVSVIVLLLLQIKESLPIILKKVAKNDYFSFIVAVAFFSFTMNSMLHNKSIVTGDVLVWILWGSFEASRFLSNNKQAA